MNISFRQEDGWKLIGSIDDVTAACAADEMIDILRKITGTELRKGTGEEEENIIVFDHGIGPGDGFEWRASEKRIELFGDSSKGLLNAVYDFLGALGCAWVSPGEEGERLPSGDTLLLGKTAAHEKPAFVHRCLILGHGIFLENGADWIVWAARNRLNSVFFHFIEGPYAIGAAPVELYLSLRAALVPLARKCGMRIELGGHGLSELLPRSLFGEKAKLFRESGGLRKSDGNFCVSNLETIQIVKGNAAEYFRKYPEGEVFNLWPADVPGGAWCGCRKCGELSPSDQSLIAANAAAEVLESINPNATLNYLAYYDTENPPAKAAPRRNVSLLWAPRKRCYAHSVDEPSCLTNHKVYSEKLMDLIEEFKAAGAAPASLFEYYQDEILFKAAVPPLRKTMARDLDFYAKAGISTVQCLMTGDRPWIGPQPNLWLFCRLAWNPSLDIDGAVYDFCRYAFGSDAAELMASHFNALEEAHSFALGLEPGDIDLGLGGAGGIGVIASPPTDMDDLFSAKYERLERKAVEFDKSFSFLDMAGKNLKEAKSVCAGEKEGKAYAGTKAEFEIHECVLEFGGLRTRAYAELKAKGGAASGFALMAMVPIRNSLEWGKRNIKDPRARTNYSYLRFLLWELRIAKIRRDATWNPLTKVSNLAICVLKLLYYSSRIRNIFSPKK